MGEVFTTNDISSEMKDPYVGRPLLRSFFNHV